MVTYHHLTEFLCKISPNAPIFDTGPFLRMKPGKAVRQIRFYFIGFFFAFGFGSAGTVALMSAVRYSRSSTSLM